MNIIVTKHNQITATRIAESTLYYSQILLLYTLIDGKKRQKKSTQNEVKRMFLCTAAMNYSVDCSFSTLKHVKNVSYHLCS